MAVPPTVLRVATVVRSEVSRWVGRAGIDRKTLCGACAIGSYAFWRCLRAMRYRATFVCHFDGASGHCWVEARNHIVDITATQFGGPEVAVFEVGQTPSWLANPLVYYPGRRYENRRALGVVQTWDSQSPVGYEDRIEILAQNCASMRLGDHTWVNGLNR